MESSINKVKYVTCSDIQDSKECIQHIDCAWNNDVCSVKKNESTVIEKPKKDIKKHYAIIINTRVPTRNKTTVTPKNRSCTYKLEKTLYSRSSFNHIYILDSFDPNSPEFPSENNIIKKLKELSTLASPNSTIIFIFFGKASKSQKAFFFPQSNTNSKTEVLLYSKISQYTNKFKNTIIWAGTTIKGKKNPIKQQPLDDLKFDIENNINNHEEIFSNDGNLCRNLLNGLNGNADKNEDRVITHEELKKYIKQNIARPPIKQKPTENKEIKKNKRRW